jgi:hypothetical protein
MAEQLTLNQQVQGSTPWWITSPFFCIVSASGSPKGDEIRLPGGSPLHIYCIVSASGFPKGDDIRLPVDHLSIFLYRFSFRVPERGLNSTPWWITFTFFCIVSASGFPKGDDIRLPVDHLNMKVDLTATLLINKRAS